MKDLKGAEIQRGDKVVVNVQQVGLVEGEIVSVNSTQAKYKVHLAPPGGSYYVRKGNVKMVQSPSRIYVVEGGVVDLPDVTAYTDAARKLLIAAGRTSEP